MYLTVPNAALPNDREPPPVPAGVTGRRSRPDSGPNRLVRQIRSSLANVPTPRVFRLFALVSLAVLVVCGALAWAGGAGVLERIEANASVESGRRTLAVFERRAASLRAVAKEYGYWDATWQFAGQPDHPRNPSWLRENFVEWLPRTYGIQAMAITDGSGRVLFAWSGPSGVAAQGAIADPRILELVRRDHGVGAVLATPDGPFFVGGAEVAESEAQALAGETRGYLMVAVPMTDSLVAAIAAELQEQLSVLPGAAQPPTVISERRTSGVVEVRVALRDVLGRPAGVVAARRSRAFFTQQRRAGLLALGLAVALSSAMMVVVWILVHRVVVGPTREVARAFRTMEERGRLEPIIAPAVSPEWRTVLSSFNGTVEALRASQAQLVVAQKMEIVGRLAGGIAHDFNNLLATILASASVARDDLPRDHAVQEALGDIEHASRRAAELTRQLLTFARREQLKAAPINVNDSVTGVARLCGRTLGTDVSLVVESAPLPLTVHADAGQLEQALLNLCINARDAMAGGGTLRIETRLAEAPPTGADVVLRPTAEGPFVVISVADSGVGMSAEVRARAFEPFFTTKQRAKGTGLGLAMVFGILEAHGGGIAVQSQPGQGTRFDLYLPGGASAAAAKTEPRREIASGGDGTVLIIDDEAQLRGVLARGLTRLGFRAIEAENGRVGLERFAERDDVALVILDVVMPEMGGVEVFRRLRERRADLPIIICSGYSDDADVRSLLQAGACGLLPKPFDLFELSRMITHVLAATAATRREASA